MYTLKKYFGHLREVFKYILATFFARAPSLLCRLRTKNSVLALDIKAIRLKMYHICMAKMEQNGLRLELDERVFLYQIYRFRRIFFVDCIWMAPFAYSILLEI